MLSGEVVYQDKNRGMPRMISPAKKILMIDDDEGDRRLISRNLYNARTETDWSVLECATGGEALRLMKRQKFDCVLLDYWLPDHNGIGVLKEIRLQDVETPVIMLTGKGSENVAVEALKNGAQDYVTKNMVGQRSLTEVIEKAVQRRGAEINLLRAANFDPLTGLVNRSQLMERVDKAIARADRSRKPFAVMYMDLNGFKTINDDYGHAAGDALIKEVSARLTKSLRGCDTAARLGGDEFVILMEDLADDGLASCRTVGGRIIEKINGQPYGIEGVSLRISVSVGAAVYPDMAGNRERLLEAADRAMYEAKKTGSRDLIFAPCVAFLDA